MPTLAHLPASECWTRLAAAYTAVVSFAHEGEVHAMPVNCCVRDQAVWFRTASGVKLRAASSGARMAVTIHAHDELQHSGWSVSARGRASIRPEGPSGDGAPTVRPWLRDAGSGQWVRVDVDTITGRQLVLGPVAAR